MPWIWQPEHVKCRHCRAEFDTEPSPAGGGHKRRVFCSRECYRADAKLQSARRSAERRAREHRAEAAT